MQHDLFNRAKARQLRRNQLWHAARIACQSYEEFRANIGAIEQAVSAILTSEFGDQIAN